MGHLRVSLALHLAAAAAMVGADLHKRSLLPVTERKRTDAFVGRAALTVLFYLVVWCKKVLPALLPAPSP